MLKIEIKFTARCKMNQWLSKNLKVHWIVQGCFRAALNGYCLAKVASFKNAQLHPIRKVRKGCAVESAET